MSAEFDEKHVPDHCPGTESQSAGKVSACSGCPNQKICSSGAAKQVDDGSVERIRNRLRSIKYKIMVMSGKGGVGKSTVTSLLARMLAELNFKVAVLDIDICGPSQPTVLGVHDEEVHNSGSGWSPVYVNDNLSVMSIGFLLSNQSDAVIWRGPKKNNLIKQFLGEVDWGLLDYLIIDTPPGTSDEHLSSVQYLTACDLTGAIIVTTSQEVALLDVRKEINFCRKVNTNLIGVIENMKEFVCPNCSFSSQIFPTDSGGAKQMCDDLHVPYLGHISLDPTLTRFCDEGRDFVVENGQSPVVQQLTNIVNEIQSAISITDTNDGQING